MSSLSSVEASLEWLPDARCNEYIRDGAEQLSSKWFRDCRLGNVMGTWENTVFKIENPCAVLRLTTVEHRTSEELMAEARLLELLSTARVPVPVFIPARDGTLLSRCVIRDKSYWGMMSTWLPGKMVSRESISQSDLVVLGRLIGTIHRITDEFSRMLEPHRAFAWDDPLLDVPYKCSSRTAEYLESAKAWLKALPRERSQFGLVHADLHGRNLLRHQGRLQIIDFDDLQIHWRQYELAVIVSWLHPNLGECDDVIEPLLKGYGCSGANIKDLNLELLPLFVSLRRLLDLALVEERLNLWPRSKGLQKRRFALVKLLPEKVVSQWQ